MKHNIHPLRTAHVLLIVAVAIVTGTGAPISAHAAAAGQEPDNSWESDAAPRQKNYKKHHEDEFEYQRNKIRKEEEHKLKKGRGIRDGREQGEKNSFYPQQAKSLAERLRESAAIVAQQGGNAQPLLDAAAYFDKDAE
ncbi:MULTISPECIES: hypothetical protein [Nitrosomonas]|uniref:Uncharacterized protein n=1 Tax=Nitrosomonas communis TaxID=44574 RepID=A0A0F7K968_9PROT|nr:MULTISPECIES: hypothetical protein [Nitrosomonas]AKH36780.1 hypothetical protein AAW31_01470 [Nitrosomonas communis]TYP86694.1 hypothetical protein BCL69_102928 [Nitrosomonas communis]UVS61849.1 hypothetical protein NX761_01550 [Nitrosomonas sp. PLL12]